MDDSIAQHPVEIYDGVIGPARPNPVIDGLALCFQVGGPETGKRVPFNGVQCPADCLEPERMSAIDDLTMPMDYLRDAHNLSRIAKQGRNEDVGVALQHDHVFGTRLHEHVTVETRQSAGTNEVVQDSITWKACIQHRDL
jgi:hypothetical protein